MARKRKKYSIKQRLLSIMIITTLVQMLVCLVAIGISGGYSQLKQNEEQTFENVVLRRKNILEDSMINKWTDISGYQTEIQSTIEAELQNRGKTFDDLENDKELNREILQVVSDQIVDMLRYNSTTEAFIVLEGYGKAGTTTDYCGLCVRNLSQNSSVTKDALLMETGDNSIAQSMGIALDSNWSSKFTLDEEVMNTEFYQVPLDYVSTNPEEQLANMDYWSDFYKWKKNDIDVMAYSVPLAQDGEAYGVIGITVSRDYLANQLSSEELDSGYNGTYALVYSVDVNTYQVLYASGIQEGEIEERENILRFSKSAEADEIQLTELSTDSYANIQSLSMYREDSVSGEEEWALIGILPRRALYHDSMRMLFAMILASIIAATVGVLVAVGGSTRFVNPILRMINVLKKVDGRGQLRIPSSRVKELDELGEAVITLDAKVRENASKVFKIIELVDMPIGVIEYQKDHSKIFCTPKVIRLMGMNKLHFEDGYLERKYFDEFLQREDLQCVLEKDVEKEYQIQNKGQTSWLRIKSLHDGEKILITIVDATRDVIERRKMEYERDYDILTHLLNRRAFKRRVQQILQVEDLKLSAMVMWDLDNLKYVNDTYGHDYGDQYIQKAAAVMGTLSMRGGIVGRISGDEFMAFVPNIESKKHMLELLIGIKEQMNSTKLIMPDAEEIAIRASGGIAWYPEDGTSYEMLKTHSDFAMYDTKNTYKGAFKEFNRKVYERDGYMLKGREQLNRLIEERLIRYAFQPIISAKDGSIYAYEALARPQVPNISSAEELLRLAKTQSRLAEIEELTFDQAFRCISSQVEALGDRYLFINSIPNQLAKYRESFTKCPIDTSRLVIEIIENEQADMDVMDRKLELVRSMNAKVAVDDYGSGYSSESVLLYVTPSYVKIDMEIIRHIDSDIDRQALVAGTVEYCKNRNIKVIAEGLETYEEMRTVIELDVDYLQGFYLARPDYTIRELPTIVQKEILDLQR